MEVEIEQTAGEIKRLKACINDLISVLALPAIWSGNEPSQIVSTLLDVLLGMLRLDFAYARLSDSIGVSAPIEMVRLAQHRNLAAQPQEIGQALNPWLAGDLGTPPLVMPNPIGEGKLSIAPLRLGLQDELGVLVAGSQRANFPTDIEMLLLRVAANQAGIGLQEARLLSEQKRAAEELEQRVLERTRQLTAVNEELRKEIIERKRAEEALREAQAELAHVTRVTTLGELTSSIAHEVNQPLAAVVNNASACLRWLAGQAPNLEEARQSAALIIADGHRAGEIISRIRALAKKAPPQKDCVNINETILEVIALARSEVHRNRVSTQTQLSSDVPLILGDRIQLQQVILNLIINAIEAMSEISEGPRELQVVTGKDESQGVLVTVRDSGPGLDPDSLGHLFTAFYTTKPQGMGMGLAISRSIIEAHGGRLWAVPNDGPGATFQFTLPKYQEEA
jgi:signal transduction histidine kinase